MLLSFRARTFGTVAFVAIIGASQVIAPIQEQPFYGGGGDECGRLWPVNLPLKETIDHQKIEMIAMQHEEDEIMLHIIMQAVTNNLLNG